MFFSNVSSLGEHRIELSSMEGKANYLMIFSEIALARLTNQVSNAFEMIWIGFQPVYLHHIASFQTNHVQNLKKKKWEIEHNNYLT